jgi:uncharacterized protein involved in exopolysaccharide biosynthesis
MEDTALTIASNSFSPPAAGPRELMAAAFRWRRRMLLVFAVAASAGILTAFISPPEYESVMKILVSRERVDPLVAADQIPATAPQDISEEELNSEMELMKSDDVLRQVVAATGLRNKIAPTLGFGQFGRASATTEQIQTAKAVRKLSTALAITLPKKSDIITISYRSKQGPLSVAVLDALARSYFEKHLAVHRPRGQFEFFEQQAEQARRSLSEVQAAINESARKSGIFAGPVDLDLVVQKLSDQRLALQETYTAIAETQKRIAALDAQVSTTSARMTTAIRTADNPELMMQLKGTLLQLELKRTDLLQKFQPTHRNVQEVEQQIAQTQAAITAAQSAPVTDRTTDRDPTYEWMRSELAKAHTELISLQARAGAIAKSTAGYTERARSLSEGNLQQQQLLGRAKALEETYQLYLQKREQARISDALDRDKILNVSLAQAPSLAVLPTHSPVGVACGAIFFALFLSVATGFISERLDSSFRSPDEIQKYLDIPVIAALPSGGVEKEWRRRPAESL